MFPKTIPYTDLNGNDAKAELWFHMNEAELAEMQYSRKGGMASYVDEIVGAEDMASLIAIFKELVLMSVGERSEDGLEFFKSQEYRDKLVRSDVYSALFMELVTDTKKGIEFFNGLVPKKLRDEYEAQKKAENEKTYTDAQLLAMSWEDFHKAAGGKGNEKNWDPRFLMIGYQRKSNEQAAA
jgi:hypothetical protein